MPRLATPIKEPPLPLLVTGVTGVAGYHALRFFQEKYPGQVVGLGPTSNGHGLTGVERCDSEDGAALARLFDRHRFASVLDCGGNCALKACELDPAMAWRINVTGVQTLLTQTAPRGARLVHLSVDLVFSGAGRSGGYLEDDPTDPVTVYGKTMVVGEQAILAADPRACILRISLPMGTSLNGHAGAIDWIQSRFKKSRPATLYVDEIRTPTYTGCLSRVCEAALAGGLAGVFHAGGPSRMSLYQIAQVINRVGGYDPDLLFGIPRGEAGPVPPRAGNVAMDSGKLARALGQQPFDPWPLDPRWTPTHRDWHRERPPGEDRSPQLLLEALASNPAQGMRPISAGEDCTVPEGVAPQKLDVSPSTLDSPPQPGHNESRRGP